MISDRIFDGPIRLFKETMVYPWMKKTTKKKLKVTELYFNEYDGQQDTPISLLNNDIGVISNSLDYGFVKQYPK